MNRNDENQKIKSFLKQVEVLIDKQNEIKKATGENFNIFSVLKMERNEVETHSALIFELINPSGSHSQGRQFLDEFVRDVLGEENFKTDEYINVEREKFCGKEGRIDLWIENDEKNLIIEMKIDAGDQENQLKRYKKYAEKQNKGYQIFYLTLFGNEASEKSKGKGKGKVECKDISFQVDVLGWIENSIKLVTLKPVLRETLRQYSVLIRKITNLASQESEMEIINTLLKDSNLIVADQIAKSLPRAKAEVEYEFWKSLYDKIESDEEMPFRYDWFIFEKFDFKNKDDDIIGEIVKERNKKNGEMGLHYYVGDVKKDKYKLYLDVSANTVGKILFSLFLWDDEKEEMPKTWSKYRDLKKVLEGLGFSKSAEQKTIYIPYSYEDIFEYHCKGDLAELADKIKDKFVDVSKTVYNSKELRKLVEIKSK